MASEIHVLCRNIIFPEFYFSGRKGIPSDREFIGKCLQFMSDSNKKMACAHYRELYLKSGRKEANTFLKKFADEFGVTRAEYEESKIAAGGLNKKFRDIIDRIKEAKKGRVSIISLAEATAPEPDKTGMVKGTQAKRRRRQWATFEK